MSTDWIFAITLRGMRGWGGVLCLILRKNRLSSGSKTSSYQWNYTASQNEAC